MRYRCDTPRSIGGNEEFVGPGEDENGEVTMVMVQKHAEYGENIVNSSRNTLYMFDQDAQDAKESAFQNECAENWPPLVRPGPNESVQGDNVSADLTTFEREEGSQIVVNGWPMYRYFEDSEPGDTLGQGISDAWWILDPDGAPIKRVIQDDDDDGYQYCIF